MRSVLISVLVVLSLFAILIVVLFGDLPSFKGSYVHRLHLWINHRLSVISNELIRLNKRYFHSVISLYLLKKLQRVYRWLPPGIYISLFTFLIQQFYLYLYPRIENPRRILIACSLIVNIVAFILGIYTDPGDLSKIDIRRCGKYFPYNELIFFNYQSQTQKMCRTCHLLKLARSKHCSTCGKCILFFDHHCLWLNNCVGYYNYKWFLLFLISFEWILLYGSYLNYQILSMEMPQFVEITGNVIQRWYNLISHTSTANERTGILYLLCISLPWLITWFTFEHWQFIYLGMTTNELAKWDFVRYLVLEGMLYRYENGEYVTYLVKDHGDQSYYRLSDETLVAVDNGNLVKITNMAEQLDNIYDLGFWENFKQRIITNRYD